jgi:hypothetical protein
MSVFLLAFAMLFADGQAAVPAPAPTAAESVLTDSSPPAAEELPYPVGAPRDDYGLVAWCYGALGGYVDLHDQVMPEVTRIESTYRRPGSVLADDLKVYADLQKTSRANLKLFSRAMEAAEKASLKPINRIGATAVQQGHKTWAGSDTIPKARLAQEWMGWTLPARCTPTATALEQRAKLLGTAFQVNVPAEAAPASDVAPAPADAPAAEAPPVEAPPPETPTADAPAPN